MLALPVSVTDKVVTFGFRITVRHSLGVFNKVRRIIVSFIRQKSVLLKIDMFISGFYGAIGKVAKGSVKHTAPSEELCFTLASGRAER